MGAKKNRRKAALAVAESLENLHQHFESRGPNYKCIGSRNLSDRKQETEAYDHAEIQQEITQERMQRFTKDLADEYRAKAGG